MYNLDQAYSEKFFRQRRSLHWRTKLITNALIHVFNPSSVVDVGCGNGDLIGTIASVPGMENTLAIEGTENSLPYITENYNGTILIHDMRKSLSLDYPDLPRYELCMCLEVAEHIEDEYAPVFVHNLASLSDTLLFSFAPPGQGGLHHVNCRPFEYWFYKFDAVGYAKNVWKTEAFKEGLKPFAHKKGIKAYYNNAIVFERRS